MNTRMQFELAALALATLLTASTRAQEPAAPPANTQAPPAHNNIRKAIPWKQFNYTCEGGSRLTVYLADPYAKVRYENKTYIMKQTVSADGNRYSDGKLVWWGKGNGGFLQEDSADGNGKMILKDCQLIPPPETASVTGTVSYLQRMALPPNAVIQVALLDVSQRDDTEKVIAEQKLNLGQRQVPVPFTLKFDPAKIDQKHAYAVSAKITVDGKMWFATEQAYPVLTEGKPSHVELILKQVPSTESAP
jgi:uncharacterized lipoprotein YbaY